ncbi:hypothetical protein BD410DRAFT_789440 [Rickenella mellea]|uniref:Uncharacterized protein n=1 Tax=Rickenella mellea TaxID=50990 RepID=A0A4Y7Q447_9AGAM|nr:hypothetical protein BD410DRAFT_789440 [Rickenella mellea]
MAGPPTQQFVLKDSTADLLHSCLTRVKDNDNKIDLDASWKPWLPDLKDEENSFSFTEGRWLRELTALEDALGVLLDGVTKGRRILDQKRLKASVKRKFDPNSIPNEVLSGIFEAAYDCDIWDNETSRQVSHVSRRFRAVALDTPFIWSVVHNAQSSEELGVFLDRSKRTKLTVCLNEHFGSKTYLCPKISTEEFMRAVSKPEIRHCWYEFRCTVDNKEDVKTIGKLTGGKRWDLPFLTSMTFISRIRYNDPIRANFCRIWRAPSLRHFSGINTYLPNPTIGKTLKSAVLDFEDHALSDALHSALKSIAKVQTLTIRVDRGDQFVEPPSKFVDLSNLESMTVLSPRELSCLYSNDRHTFEWFTTKKVTELTFRMDHTGNCSALGFSFPGENPYPFLQELEVICNKYTNFGDHVFPRVLAKLPSLRRLSIMASRTVHLKTLRQKGVKFPPLHTLRLHYCSGINDADIREIVSELRRGPEWSEFRRLELHHCPAISIQYLQRLKENLGDKLSYVASLYFKGS